MLIPGYERVAPARRRHEAPFAYVRVMREAQQHGERQCGLTAEQCYELDLNGFLVIRGHYDRAAQEQLHTGIDELQAIPVDYEHYRRLGIASHHLAAAMEDPRHSFWSTDQPGRVGRVDMALCGTERLDLLVRDPLHAAIHRTLAGGPVYISASYFIEKAGPAAGGRLHNGGYPGNRHLHYAYDHATGSFRCTSTKSVVVLSDMTQIENGPFAAIPGSHKANFACPFEMDDAANNPLAVPVLAAPGDVIIFTEALTHNAYPVTNDTVRRSVFLNFMPAIDRDNLPSQRMSIYPPHVLERLRDCADLLTAPGYI